MSSTSGQCIAVAVTVEQALQLMGISRSQFYRELAAGRINARKVGKRTIVPMDEIRRWVENLPTYTPDKTTP